MAKPRLESIISRMDMGCDFSMTRQEYIRATGADIPQNKYYTEKNSAVAKKAHERGFNVIVIPEKIEFHKL